MKAQVQAQTLVYVFAMVVASLILILGYLFVGRLTGDVAQANYDSFKLNLDSDLELVHSNFGYEKVAVYHVPQSFESVCFVSDSQNFCDDISKYPLVQNFLNANPQSNLFLVSKNGLEAMQLDNLSLECSFKCFRAEQGRITLTLKGLDVGLSVQ